MERLGRHFGKDKRTIQKLIRGLLNDGFMGQDSIRYFLRNATFITARLGVGTRAFHCTTEQIRDKKTFEGLLFAARVDFMSRYYRRKRISESAKHRGCTIQIAKTATPFNTGLLKESFQISTGKITQIKRFAALKGFLKVRKTFTPIAPGSAHTATLLLDELPGVFSRDGILVRRASDEIESFISTFRIKGRRPINHHILWMKKKK
jgi:hypothetical protein